MTEIRIEKKKPVWPWILLGFVVVAVLVYFLVLRDNDDAITEVPTSTELVGANEKDFISVKENNSTVSDFVNFVETDKDKMGLDHAYTNEAFLKLIDATYAIADEVGYEVRADLEQVKQYAEMITDDPFVTTHANSIRKAGDILTNALQNIQKAKYPGLTNEVAELRNASEAINPDVLTLNQRTEVKSFFGKAADLLKKMN